MDEYTLHEILNEVDLNKNGQVELNEFLQVSCSERKRMYLLFTFWLSVVFKNKFLSTHSCYLILKKWRA